MGGTNGRPAQLAADRAAPGSPIPNRPTRTPWDADGRPLPADRPRPDVLPACCGDLHGTYPATGPSGTRLDPASASPGPHQSDARTGRDLERRVRPSGPDLLGSDDGTGGRLLPDGRGEFLSLPGIVGADDEEPPPAHDRVARSAKPVGQGHRIAVRWELHPDLEHRDPARQRLARLLGLEPPPLGGELLRRGGQRDVSRLPLLRHRVPAVETVVGNHAVGGQQYADRLLSRD